MCDIQAFCLKKHVIIYHAIRLRLYGYLESGGSGLQSFSISNVGPKNSKALSEIESAYEASKLTEIASIHREYLRHRIALTTDGQVRRVPIFLIDMEAAPFAYGARSQAIASYTTRISRYARRKRAMGYLPRMAFISRDRLGSFPAQFKWRESIPICAVPLPSIYMCMIEKYAISEICNHRVVNDSGGLSVGTFANGYAGISAPPPEKMGALRRRY